MAFRDISEYGAGVRANRAFPPFARGQMVHGFLELGTEGGRVVPLSAGHRH